MNLEILAAPLEPSAVEWRYQSATKDGQKIIVVPYVTNREIMRRLDEAFGIFGWKSSFKEVEGGFLCTLSALDDKGVWVSKEDGAPRTDIEPIKGGVSNAMKRTAVQFGIGRNLYDFPKVFIESSDKFLPGWAMPLLDKMVEKINSGAVMRDVVVLKQADAQKLQQR